MVERVRAGGVYVYNPNLLDQFQPPVGAKAGVLKPGMKVRVVALPGCPKPGVMGHAHIQSVDAKGFHPIRKDEPVYEFYGLVSLGSLDKVN